MRAMKSLLMQNSGVLIVSSLLALCVPSYAADTKEAPPSKPPTPAANAPASTPKKPAEKPEDIPNPEAEYYRIIQLTVPKDIILECGALELMPDGRLTVGTRRAEIYMVEGAFTDPPAPKFT